MNYNKQYFIDKFNAIPEDQIGSSQLDNHCALWHCGVRPDENEYIATEESAALVLLFEGVNPTDYAAVYRVNDGSLEYRNNKFHKYKLLGDTPKERILKRLSEIV